MTAPPSAGADVDTAVAALAAARAVVSAAAGHLAAMGPDAVEVNQVVAYDLAHAAAAVATGEAMIAYGRRGETEGRLTAAFAADVVSDLASRLVGRAAGWGVDDDALGPALKTLGPYREPTWLETLADQPGPRHLPPEFELVADTFRRFAQDRIAPVAEHVHRNNGDVPEDIIEGLGALGAFGLSIPEAYGGYANGGESDYLGMVIATEELSRASLGAGGSLITRPEILARALLRGGTERQKQRWLPRLATGEIMAAVAVTEPDYGSDVAGVSVSATRAGDGWLVNGTKTWSTFAARAEVLMLLARTDPDRGSAHRGLSLFVVEKPRADSSGFVLDQTGGGRLEGRPIDTIGYRGMHSYELSFRDWRVPAADLIGEEAGVGKGFYLQMEGFENGRLQTAARAVGVMQAAYDAAASYAADRVVFGRPVGSYQLTKVKLARMAVLIQAARQSMYHVGRQMALGGGRLEASMIKAYVCRAAEWVTREAMQIHGGMGYAEEYLVSRLFVDARVLSIFEGADETLALKVIARRLVERVGG